jgi:hypothetical protein
VPHIYAAGDVIGFPSLASTSMEQGRLAACDAFGQETTSFPEFFPFGVYAVPEISMVGATEQDLVAKRIPFETGVARLRETARGQILGIESGLLKLLFSIETRKLLGAHILGEGATELIHIGQAALALGGTLEYFVESVFNYPTLAEAYKIAALDAWNRMPRRREVPRPPAGAAPPENGNGSGTPDRVLVDLPPLPSGLTPTTPPPATTAAWMPLTKRPAGLSFATYRTRSETRTTEAAPSA